MRECTYTRFPPRSIASCLHCKGRRVASALEESTCSNRESDRHSPFLCQIPGQSQANTFIIGVQSEFLTLMGTRLSRVPCFPILRLLTRLVKSLTLHGLAFLDFLQKPSRGTSCEPRQSIAILLSKDVVRIKN